MVHFANSRFFSFHKIQIFFHFAKSIFFSFHKIQIHRLATSFSDSENSPLECKLFLLSECLITSYVYLCLIFTIGSFRKIQIFFHFAKSSFFFHFTKFRFTGLRPRFQIAKIVPWMHALFIIRTLHHIICLPLFNIYNWFISQNPDFFY